ncbi:MAG: glycine/sarcosine/betaine reductase complex component C subunit alpha, partial [Defluviitaleaceae bacterium]|nr:glycine/sarcosine/betaine reductase complex component C subunit alpha [Defluviitaleaceae bacterium]
GDVPEANYKMIAALAVMRKELERADINNFIEKHGMSGWAPTQGHIPSGVPYLGFARVELTTGKLNKAMVIGKGSLFLGRMTNQFDGVSILLERNPGKKAENRAAVKSVRIGLTLGGSELGDAELVKAAEKAARDNDNIEVVLIGAKVQTSLELIETGDAHKKMESMLDSGALDGCVTMHYNFPIGVSTIGRVQTPAFGNDMLLAATTGTSAIDRVEAMVRNAVGGIAVAKAMGIPKPSVGVLNLDGARLAERELLSLKEKGYNISFGESGREDGGVVMRGNDLLQGGVDVMVTDSLTGNIMMKVFSAYTTGGAYEAMGDGYGPGVGSGYKRLVMIVSRASGAAVVANAIAYGARLAKAGLMKYVEAEFAAAEKAGLISAPKKGSKEPTAEAVEGPAKEVVDEEIAGIDILELEDAVGCLKAAGIYAESGMGCTGPVVMVSKARAEKAKELLKENKFL